MHDLELQTDSWAGEKIFEIEHPRCVGDLPRRDENTLVIGERNVSYRSYSQRQRCADYYSLLQIAQWFTFREEVEEKLGEFESDEHAIVAHIRRGDYCGSIYPLVSLASYERQALQVWPAYKLDFVFEEQPAKHPDFTGELSFLPDFFRMVTASQLLRANSSFSFWAASIGYGYCANWKEVWSPIIGGCRGGIEHECQFQPDNWARIAELDCVEQITIKP